MCRQILLLIVFSVPIWYALCYNPLLSEQRCNTFCLTEEIRFIAGPNFALNGSRHYSFQIKCNEYWCDTLVKCSTQWEWHRNLLPKHELNGDQIFNYGTHYVCIDFNKGNYRGNGPISTHAWLKTELKIKVCISWPVMNGCGSYIPVCITFSGRRAQQSHLSRFTNRSVIWYDSILSSDSTHDYNGKWPTSLCMKFLIFSKKYRVFIFLFIYLYII
jgi:hypothetical protein